MHACVGPILSTHAGGGAPSSDLMSCIFYFKKTIVVTSLGDISRHVATVEARPSLLCNHSSNETVAMVVSPLHELLSVTTVPYVVVFLILSPPTPSFARSTEHEEQTPLKQCKSKSILDHHIIILYIIMPQSIKHGLGHKSVIDSIVRCPK
jgi:hypothetical protein